jgi:hypothetical protein
MIRRSSKDVMAGMGSIETSLIYGRILEKYSRWAGNVDEGS